MLCCIIPCTWGSQRTCDPRHQAIFSGAIGGDLEGSARGVSHILSLYFVILSCLVYFLLVSFCLPFALKLKNTKKNKNSSTKFVSILSCYYVLFLTCYQWLLSVRLDLIGKVGSRRNNRNIIRTTASLKKGNTYGHK